MICIHSTQENMLLYRSEIMLCNRDSSCRHMLGLCKLNSRKGFLIAESSAELMIEYYYNLFSISLFNTQWTSTT